MRNNEELRRSHANGFGGSDAKMFAKIGTRGIESLSTTNKKRILVALGKMEADDFGGNVYTEAGHLFEDWCANETHLKDYKREAYIGSDDAGRSFKVFAHADFYDEQSGTVYELKYSQDATDKVVVDYYNQLQWYYMLGAKHVVLVHGWGNVLPFDIQGLHTVDIGRDNAVIHGMLCGIGVLDLAVKQGAFDDCDTTEVTVSELSEVQLQACEQLQAAVQTIKTIEAKAEEAKATLLAWMETNGVLSIKGDGFTVSYVSPTTRKTFDAKKAQADFPALKDEQYYKTSAVKSSVKIALKP